MRRPNVMAMGAALVGLSAWLVLGAGSGQSGEKGKVTLSKAELTRLVSHDAKAIQEALAKGMLDKKTTRKVRAAAFMVALYAQGGGLTGLRDTALKVNKLVEDGNVKEAAALAAKLTLDAKGEGKGDPVVWEKQLEFENVMHQFSSERVGGFGMEKEFGELSEIKEAFTKEQMERLALLAGKMAMIAHVSSFYSDDKEDTSVNKMKTKANWLKFTQNFHTAARALVEAADGKNEGATRAALERVNDSCIKCHDVFK